MAIVVELTTDEEARLRERAQERGQDPERLAGEMLGSLLLPRGSAVSPHLAPVVDDLGVFHQDRWEHVLRPISSGSTGRPVLPPEALTREALYGDHD